MPEDDASAMDLLATLPLRASQTAGLTLPIAEDDDAENEAEENRAGDGGAEGSRFLMRVLQNFPFFDLSSATYSALLHKQALGPVDAGCGLHFSEVPRANAR